MTVDTFVRWHGRARRAITVLLSASIVMMALCLALPAWALLSHSRLVVVDGYSMAPTMTKGSAFFAHPVAPEVLRVGDVVTFHNSANTLTTHRIIALKSITGGAFMQTQGDANTAADPILTPLSSVIGRAQDLVPSMGVFARAIVDPWDRVVIFGIPLLLLAIAQLLSLITVQPVKTGKRRANTRG